MSSKHGHYEVSTFLLADNFLSCNSWVQIVCTEDFSAYETVQNQCSYHDIR